MARSSNGNWYIAVGELDFWKYFLVVEASSPYLVDAKSNRHVEFQSVAYISRCEFRGVAREAPLVFIASNIHKDGECLLSPRFHLIKP